MLMHTILIGAALLGGAAAGPANSTRDHTASTSGNLVVMAASRKQLRVWRKQRMAKAAVAKIEAEDAASSAAAQDAKQSQQNAKDTLSRYLCLQSGTC